MKRVLNDLLFGAGKPDSKTEGAVQPVGRVCVGKMLNLEITLYEALAKLQRFLFVIIIFMGKGTCNSLGSAICLQGLVCQIWTQRQFSTVGVHGWHVCVCTWAQVFACALLCVCPWRWHGRQSIPGLARSFLPPTHLPNVSRIIN